MKGRETPAGVFTILEKRADHRSNLYDDAEMPHMQRLTWNGIAMHGGILPGRPASKGCVRLPYGFASDLFERTQLGMRVVISPFDAALDEISHPALLVPNAATAAATPERAERLAEEAKEAANLASEAKKAAKAAARAAAPVAAALRNLERRKSSADAELVSAEKAPATAKTDKALARAEERKVKAATQAAEAFARLESARVEAQAKIDAAASTKEAAKAATDKMPEAAKAASEAKLDLEPVSIFISRATQKIYVRRNTANPGRTGARCTKRPSKFLSRSATRTVRSVRTFSLRWRLLRTRFAGPRSRSTTGTTPTAHSTALPYQKYSRSHCVGRTATFVNHYL